MSLPSYLRSDGGDCVVTVKAQPRAKSTGIAGLHGDALKIRLAAPPVDGEANEELIRFMADCLGVPKGRVRVLRGAGSTHKQVQIVGMDAAGAAQRLQGAMESPK
jgi:hypothetical protein